MEIWGTFIKRGVPCRLVLKPLGTAVYDTPSAQPRLQGAVPIHAQLNVVDLMRRILILEVRTEVHRLTIRNRLTRPRVVGVVVNSHRLARPIPDRGHIVLHTLTSTISVPLELIAVGLTSPIVWDGTTEVGEKRYLTSRAFLLEFAAENTVNFKKSTV